jgi:hypothetical protein
VKWPYASLTDQQVRTTYFIPPDIFNIYALALGEEGYERFCSRREMIRARGGDLLLIGWPDGTSITYATVNARDPISVETLVETYRASAAMQES